MPVGSSRSSNRYSMNPMQTRASYNAAPISTSFLDDTDNDQLTLSGLDLKSPIAQTIAQLEGDDFPTLTSDGLRVRSLLRSPLIRANPRSALCKLCRS
jgi:hypothetical protein